MVKHEHEGDPALAEIVEKSPVFGHYRRVESGVRGALETRPVYPAAVYRAEAGDIARVFGAALFVVGGAIEDVTVVSNQSFPGMIEHRLDLGGGGGGTEKEVGRK